MSVKEGRRRESSGEIERLKRELAAVQQRLDDEVAYYRAETEATRQRVEAEQVRVHAQEVARRREVENDLASTRSELRQVREQADRLQRRYDELNKQYMQLEESARLDAEEQVAQTRAAARDAWQSAEEELAAMEAELSEARRSLTQEQQRSRQLEETLGSLQKLEGAGDEDRQAALVQEVTALKKALGLSERARAQAQKRAVRLAEKLVAAQEGEREPSSGDSPGSTAATHRRGGSANPVQVDLSEANAVLSAAHGSSGASGGEAPDAGSGGGGPLSLEAELADEFRLIQADTSLDRSKIERLQQQVEAEDRREADRKRREAAKARPKPAVVAEAESQQQAAGTVPAGGRAHGRLRAKSEMSSPGSPRRGQWSGIAAVVGLLGALGAGSAWFLGLIP